MISPDGAKQILGIDRMSKALALIGLVYVLSDDGRGRVEPKCFPAGTMILMADGSLKPIEEIKQGDLVAAFDFEKGELVAKEVTETFENFTNVWVDIEIAGEKVTATRHHPFWIESKQEWVLAEFLEAGMTVRNKRGEIVAITSVEIRYEQSDAATYNFEVADVHNYFVGAEGILVHNPDGQPPVPTPNGPPPVPVPGGGTWTQQGPQRDGVPTWVPAEPVQTESGSQPGASWDPSGHWDVDDGSGNRQRYDWRGNPISPDQAHDPDRPPTPRNNPRC
jgi:hypothetical protein